MQMRNRRVWLLLLACPSAWLGGCGDDDSSGGAAGATGGSSSASAGSSASADALINRLGGERLLSALDERETRELCDGLLVWRLEIFGEETLLELECVADGVRAGGDPAHLNVAQCEAAAAACRAQPPPRPNLCDAFSPDALSHCDVTVREYTACARAGFASSAAMSDQFTCARFGNDPPTAPVMIDRSMVGLASIAACAPLLDRCAGP